jgi:hypothetical protein
VPRSLRRQSFYSRSGTRPLAFAYRDAFHARGCVLYFADRRLLSSDPDRQGDFGEQAVKAQIDNLDRARAIAGGIAAKFRSHRDPGGHPALGFRRTGGPRPVLGPDPGTIASAVWFFERYATGHYSDDTLALEAAREGLRSGRTGRPLTAAGIAELLRNPIYNGYLVRFRGFSDEERVEAPWRIRAMAGSDGSSDSIVDPPVSDTLWERVQAIRAERATPGTRSTRERVYVPRLFCHGCGAALRGHASSGNRRMTHPATVCAAWLDASGRRTSFRAEIYEWQIAALLATARVDETAKARIVTALQGAEPLADMRRIGRLEQELRAIALDNAFGRMSDEVYLRRKAELAAEIETARRPHPAASRVEPGRAIAYLDDLRTLWDAELPDAPDHAAIRREYELRRAEATAVAFDRLEALGPVIVEAKLSEDAVAGASLALSLEPTRAELVGDRAEVVRRLLDGRRSRVRYADTPEARRKRRQRTDDGTLRCIGRGERI